MKTFTSYVNDIPRIINNSLADNLTWAEEVINDSIRYLVTKYYFNERSFNIPGNLIAQQQFYNLPPQIKKIINITVTVGGVIWQPKECPSRQYWDALNVIPFYNDFPQFFFVYNGQVGLYPIPASSGNTCTINYKTRIPDLSQADTTITGASGSTGISFTSGQVTGTVSGTTLTQAMGESTWIRMPHSATNTIDGDNKWYEISSIPNTTTVVLKNTYAGPTISGASFTIGEVPILPEDYQDLPLYRLGFIYYTTRNPDSGKAQFYQKLWDDGVKALDDEFGSKTTNVIITDTDAQVINPNLFTRQVS